MRLVDGVDEGSWTNFVRASPQGSIFQSPEMAKVYAETKDYEPISLFVLDDGQIQGMVLAYLLWNGRWPARFLSRRCLVQGGPLFTRREHGSLALKGLDERVSNRAIFTEVRNLADTSPAMPVYESSGYSYVPHLNYRLDLRKGEEGLWSGMSKGRRKGIRRGEKSDLEVVEVSSEKGVEDFYEILDETYSNLRVPVADKSLFVSAFRILKPLGEARFLLCKSGGTTVACRGVLLSGKTIFDWYAGSISGDKARFADELLVWDILRWGISEGFETFDFGGAGSPNEEYGPREFKRRFGGEMFEPGRFEKVYKPTLFSFSKRMFGFYRRLL